MVSLKGQFTSQPATPLAAYASDPLINLFLTYFFQSNPDYFKDSGHDDALGMSYSYQLQAAPQAKLTELAVQARRPSPHARQAAPVQNPTPPTPPPHNIQVNLAAVAIEVTKDGSPQPLLNIVTPVVGYGVLAISSGQLSISQLALSIQGQSFGDKLLQRMIDDHVVPSLQALLQNIPLPQLQNLFDKGINVQVQNANVGSYSVEGQELAIGINLANMGGFNPAAMPSVADMVQLHNGGTSSASAEVLIAGDAASSLIPTLMGLISYPFDQQSESNGWGAGARGTLYCSPPYLKIANGQAYAFVTINISLEVGIEGFWLWTWSGISVPTTDAIVDLELQSAGNEGFIHLTGLEQIQVDLGNWPVIFEPVESVIEGIIDQILSAFQGVISAALQQVYIKLFDLPSAIPGTSIPAALSFAPGGLSFYLNSVRALVDIAV